MPNWSRRRALHAIGTVATVAVAGCSGGSDGFQVAAPDDRGDPVTDYELRKVRDSSGKAIFWRSDEDDRSSEAGRQTRSHAYVASEDDVASLSFAPDSDAAAELAAFVGETDFGSSSVLLESQGIQECYDLEFRGVWRDNDGLQTAYCSRLRPAGVACSTESKDAVGVGVRVPFSLADTSRFGTSWSSHCRPSPVGGSPPGGDTGDDGGDGA